MSRAFVKEDADAPPVAPLERAISSAANRVTPRGARLIDEQVATLEAALADTSDEDDAALLRRDLRYWIARRATAQFVEPDPAPEAAGFGTRVTIRRGGNVSELSIVGEDEADPEAGLLAWTSPLAQALDNAEPGDTVQLSAGGRTVPVTLIAVGPAKADPGAS
jgi:transcription elongation GreA/GreB family factor